MEKFDVNLIQDNLVELLTNTINISSLFYQVFIDPTPHSDITLDQWVYKDGTMVMETTTGIKNLAAIESNISSQVEDIVDEKLDEYVKDTDYASQNTVGVAAIDGVTVDLNSDHQLYVKGDSLTVAHSETSSLAAEATIVATIQNQNDSSPYSNIKIWVGTQAEYDIIEKANDTLYFIKEEQPQE